MVIRVTIFETFCDIPLEEKVFSGAGQLLLGWWEIDDANEILGRDLHCRFSKQRCNKKRGEYMK